MAMPKAQRIQQSITTRLKKLKKQGKFTSEDFDYLYKRTRHELYNLAIEADKLEEIKKIIERR